MALGALTTVGRHPENTIQILDRSLSKEHCVIENRNGKFFLRDLGSLNGTFVNGTRAPTLGTATGSTANAVASGSTGTLEHTLDFSGSLGDAVVVGIELRAGDELLIGATRARFEVASLSKEAPEPAKPTPEKPALESPAPLPRTPKANPPMAGTHMGLGPPASIPAAPAGPAASTLVQIQDRAGAIGVQISAKEQGFLAFDEAQKDPALLRSDYERLRLSYELSREVGAERDLQRVLEKILAKLVNFVRADRGVILLRDASEELSPRASLRRDGGKDEIRLSRTILEHVVRERAAVLTHDAAMDFANATGKSMVLNSITSAIVVPLIVSHHSGDRVLGVLWLDSASLAHFQPKDLTMLSAVAYQAATFIENNMLGVQVEREIVQRERFSRLLSPNVAERVISGELEVKPGGQRMENCSVMNTDIRGFTSLSEQTSPEQLVEWLNGYFELMVDTLFKHDGTLDKFMGDGLLAVWGAPVGHKDHASRSVDSALEMLQLLEGFNAHRVQRREPALAVGIGIHTGPLVAGYIGSSRALSYTIIGDTVNTSARLCSAAKGGQLIVSEPVLAALGEGYDVIELAPAKLKGKEKPLRVFEVRGRLRRQRSLHATLQR